MATKPLRSIKFPGLSDTYTVPQIDNQLATAGKAADAKKVGDEIADLKSAINVLEDSLTKDVKSKNLLDTSKAIVGQLSSDGTVNTSQTGYKTSDFIFLKGGKTYSFARELTNGTVSPEIMGYSGYGFYDTSKIWVENSRVWGNNGAVALTISPVSDCYIKVCGASGFFDPTAVACFIVQEGALDGWHDYFAPYKEVTAITEDDISQESGQNVKKVMSQKAVTDLVDEAIPQKMDDIVDAFSMEVGKNKYNPDACNPQDGYYYASNNSGAVTAGSTYAITGKIPCEAQKTYTFSAGGVTVYKAFYFSGETGGTYISASDAGIAGNPLTFTTPENCTFVGFNLFADSHTTAQYNTAIAAGQLELGSVASAYEPYTETPVLPAKNVENGSVLESVANVVCEESQVNLYDKSLAVDGKYINSGSVVSNANLAWTGKIPVKPNTQYNISPSLTAPMEMNTSIQQWAADGSFISSLTPNGANSYLVPFVTSSNTYFISVNMTLASHTTQNFNDTIDTIMLCYGTQRPAVYSAYNKESVLLSEKLDNAYFNPDVFTGKTWLACGTSITWYDSKKYSAGVHTGEVCRGYVGNVARRKQLNVVNDGISGATLMGTGASALIQRYQTLDWANADIATLEFGVNDFGNANPVGTANDEAGTDTFAACLKTVIEYALAQNPTLCLVICTEPDVRGSTTNSNGNTLKDYIDVTLEIAEQYRLPVCDWYYHSGINALNKGDSTKDWMTCDGTHPNDAGHLRMGAMLNQVFDSLIC